MYTLKVDGAFEAAHRIAGYPGKCDRLHGHNWRVEATIAGTELDDLGMLVDFKLVKKALKDVLEELDHRYLNELAPFNEGVNPTAENLSRLIFEHLEGAEIFTKGTRLLSICVWESPNSSVTYTRD